MFETDVGSSSYISASDVDKWQSLHFTSVDDAYSFYCDHAHRLGFSMRKGKQIRRDTRNQKIDFFFYMYYVCNNHGLKREFDSTYVIMSWFDEHSHPLHPPELAHYIKSNRHINEFQTKLIENNAYAGLYVKSSYKLISKAAGGRSNVGYLMSDLKNYLRSKRATKMAPGDLSILLELWSFEVKSKINFFYEIQLDEDDLITNIF
ncbi:hypothetical protein LIER_02162 [Lithospermum erythrorhizon]|uniref:Protein FAR1-RELATED SEQUENCE n=1 Tax=Lithospermum erythrorhizon TaxID=34254 RepID=A0AAV3NT59_LITER